MSLTKGDFIKFEDLLQKALNPRFERIENDIRQIKITLNDHTDMLAEILDRMNRTQLPIIERRGEENTREIAKIKKVLHLK
jgi:hypothetical protein